MSATVTLDGRNVTGVTLDGVTITRGRSSIYEDISPGVCVATLLSGDVAPDAWQGESGYTDVYTDIWKGFEVAARVGVPMVVETSGESGYTDVYTDLWKGAGAVRFTGTVTAVDYTPGELTITAVDALETLGRVYVQNGRQEETDFNRAAGYANLANVSLGYMGTLSVRLVSVEPSTDPVTALTALMNVANNSDAQVFADFENRLYYRRRDSAPPALIVLPPEVTLTEALIVSDELGDIYNVERVAYGPANSRQVVERTNQISINKYGRREWRQYETQLLDRQAAIDLGDYWLAHDSNPGYRIKDVQILIDENHLEGWGDSIDLFVPVRLPQLPTGSPIENYSGVILGYTETITKATRVINLHLANPDYLTEGSSYAIATPAR